MHHLISLCHYVLWEYFQIHVAQQWRTQEFCSTEGGKGGGRGSSNSVEDRENGDLGTVALLVRGSGGSCNLVQEISFHIVKFS